jgi:biotin synthase
MITNKHAVGDTLAITEYLRQRVNLPISLLISPTIVNKTTLESLKHAGADMIGIAIDTATKVLFDEHRGKGVKGPHKWETYWQILKDAVDVFGRDKAGAHLIVGLGETESEMIETIQRVRDIGANTHLFSFYPEQGSLLEDRCSCDVGQYRRVQLARYLIDNKLSRAEQMKFDNTGRVVSFGMNGNQLDEIIDSGKPFQTSGCPGKTMDGACNRPFGDGPPSDIRSFPFKLNKQDVKKVRKQMNMYT